MSAANSYPTHFEHRSRLGQWAYRLACAGPLSLIVVAGFYPHGYPHQTPNLIAQIVWWTFYLASPVGVVLGIISLIQIRRSLFQMASCNYGVAAIIVGLAASFVIFHATPDLSGPMWPYMARKASCESNLKQMGLAMTQYIQDYDEYYPLPQTWNETVAPYGKNSDIFQCPSESVQNAPSYAMNRHLAGIALAEVKATAETVQSFESVPGKNRVGGIQMLPNPPRHGDGENFGFVDGHVKFYVAENIKALKWAIPPKAAPAKKKKMGK